MQSRKFYKPSCSKELTYMLYALRRRFKRFWSKIRWTSWWHPRPKLVIRRLGKFSSNRQRREKTDTAKSVLHQKAQRPIRLASFNAALFSLAPAVPKTEKLVNFIHEEKIDNPFNPARSHPRGILKQSPIHPISNGVSGNISKEINLTKSKSKVSINLPENEISIAQNKVLNIVEDSSFSFNNSLCAMRSPICFPASMTHWLNDASLYGSRTIFDVLKEVDADVLALQDVKADEENDMRPLSDLARALGMNYVFAESWAPEYGNAVLSKWPIKRWKVQRIYDDQDFSGKSMIAILSFSVTAYATEQSKSRIWVVEFERSELYNYPKPELLMALQYHNINAKIENVVKATIDVPLTGELNIYCTQLDHLDENWRMKQINAIIQSNEQPHVLVGGLNSLDASDYSVQRWTDIVKYYEEIGKPTPKVEVTNFLKGREYTDAKNFPGECEPVVMIAKGQNVQGTCKYGTRVDYILGSKCLPYMFVPGSYSVISSKGTSDHHIVKVDIMKVEDSATKLKTSQKKLKQGAVRITHSCSSRDIWKSPS